MQSNKKGSTMTTEPTPQGDSPLLWTDARLWQLAYDIAYRWEDSTLHDVEVVRNMILPLRQEATDARAADRQRIADLEAELATLRAQADGGHWEPVPDILGIVFPDTGFPFVSETGQEVRFCRRVREKG